MRRVSRLGGLALFAGLLLLPARAARAMEPPPSHKQLTVDIDAASIGATYATRVGDGGVLIGGGGGIGISPVLGTTIATGTHFDSRGTVEVLELLNLQLFARFEPASWLKVDTGVRVGLFLHGAEDPAGGDFAALFVAPALGWRWLWIGPRVSAGVLAERGGPTEGAVIIDYLTLRLAFSW